MSHAMVSIAAPIVAARIPEALALIESMGNPATDEIAVALARLDGDEGVHFMSLHAIGPDAPGGSRGHLLLEFSADGDPDAAIARIAARIGPQLVAVFACAQDWSGGSLEAYLKAHKVRVGQGWFGEAGLAFDGTPGMSVGRIHREAALADFLAHAVGDDRTQDLAALSRLEAARAVVRGDVRFAWALETPAPLPVQPKPSTLGLVASLAASFVTTYLWPLAVPLLIVAGLGLFHAARWALSVELTADVVVRGLWAAIMWVVIVAVLTGLAVVAGLAALYLSLRKQEATDWTSDAAPKREVLREILRHENRGAQNHMISVTLQKPGFTRTMTLRLAFWIILGLASRRFKPGFLGEIGTIHFARWVTLPGTRQVVFLSNYGGSWESYLEDFITRAHNGLTAVWSNTVGFPRAENLFQKGATDGERFKRYARQSMAPTPFWYSAYRTLSTANIRTNAAIRVGLAAAMTDEEAKTWLALFGSASRPASKLETNQIQSLVFGGLGFKPHGVIMIADFQDDTAAVRAWLRDVQPLIAFGDGRRIDRAAVATLALGPGALAKAGLPPAALETFPAAYLDGMTEPGRARVLGDDPDEPWWWKHRGPYDAAILAYGDDEAAVEGLRKTVSDLLKRHGHGAPEVFPLTPVADKAYKRLEPFGFVDGTSQPVIRGTYRGLRTPDPIHLVEPGEFILGYPDNRGNLPPGPSLNALDDPHNLLPIRCDSDAGFAENVADAPREIGRNGSFLVIRQLEQDVAAFEKYCADEAKLVTGRFGEPYHVTPEFIGAKLIGRWKDGSSLVRNPYLPASDARARQKPTARPLTTSASPVPAATPVHPTEAPGPATPQRLGAAEAASRTAYTVADNDFLYGVEDPEGVHCPFGAHIRRANPRDSLEPGSQDQIDISNRHRILRVGRGFDRVKDRNPGLMFMCLNGDLERQFEFVQQTWLGSETFHGLSGERDPITTDKAGCPAGYTVPTRDGPVRLGRMERFVTPRGGGYFFLPGRRLLEFLSS
ncbi:hypothetical protein [uncultured Phenylobacterium sp.]|uniref:Dyp-type peroxidase n=1 Tax=uncultured Phenylobacterium sp. TaxID=349273 RepID=UPI0025F22B1E|nr:hypothetical protein [uncultured Phenylobacterium sp.]